MRQGRRRQRGSKVILIGSHGRGEADARTVVDLLVVEPKVANRIQEMIGLAEVLQPLRLPVDLLVISAERYDYWRDTPNTVYYRAEREGRVYAAFP